MNTAELIDEAVRTDDDLLHLQLQIARRADELAHTRSTGRNGNADRDWWLEAERDVLGRKADPALP